MNVNNRCQWNDCGAPCRVKYCAEHRAAAIKAKRQENHKTRMSNPDWVASKRATQRAYMQQRRKQMTLSEKRELHRKMRLKNRNASEEWYERTLQSQGGKCAICRASTSGNGRDWHIDHDHTTGQLRGLLCHYCNVGLGHFKDNPELLLAAVKYLRETLQQRLVA